MVIKFNKDEYNFPKGSECQFKPLIGISYSDFKNVFLFAYEMILGKGYHRNNRSGGSFKRNVNILLTNVIEGKLGEVCVYREFLKNGIDIGYPDMSVMGVNKWDNSDINYKNIKMSVKTSKSYARMMLLEENDYLISKYNNKVLYRPNKDVVDVFIFVRIKSTIIQVLEKMGDISCDDNYIRTVYKKSVIRFDQPCYVNNKDISNVIEHNMILPRGVFLNGKTRVDANNYYIFVKDMKPIAKLYSIIKQYYLI